jgi:tight adherence protein C
MISAFWPALAVTASLAVFILGYRQMRGSPTTFLDVEDLVLLREQQRREAQGLPPLERLARRFVPSLRRALGTSRLRWLQHLVDEAGRPDGITVDTILTRMVWWAFLVAPLMLVLLVQGQVLTAPLLVAVPAIMPLLRLASAQRQRRDRIDADLPDFLDVLAVTVTAGVSEHFQGPVADEMRLTLAQLANGASMRQAFTDMRSRTGSEAMAQFVTAFIQSEELGVPLADTLNQIAQDMRRSSAQRARRKAARAVPRVTLVTSVVFVPGVLVLLIVGIILGSDINFGELFSSLNGAG